LFGELGGIMTEMWEAFNMQVNAIQWRAGEIDTEMYGKCAYLHSTSLPNLELYFVKAPSKA
jgi:hypothetical protein